MFPVLKCVIERKDLIIQKASEDNAIVATERTKHIEKIKISPLK